MRTKTFFDAGTLTKGEAFDGDQQLIGFDVFWGGSPSPIFFQLFDKASPPVAGDVPKMVFRLVTGSSFVLLPAVPIDFDSGIQFAWSTTPNVFTDAAVLAAPVLVGIYAGK